MKEEDSLDKKSVVEALLFAAARYVQEEELIKHSKLEPAKLGKVLDELKQDYDGRKTSLCLLQAGTAWKLSVKDDFLPYARSIVKLAEFDRTLMETLAVIAWKHPALQCDIIKIRHNKAYEHLKQLEEMGFIARTPYKRTRKISLTKKFFEYFDLPANKAQEAFKDSLPDSVKEQIMKAEKDIEETEKEIDKAKKEDALQKGQKKLTEVDLLNENTGEEVKLEEYDVPDTSDKDKKEPAPAPKEDETYEAGIGSAPKEDDTHKTDEEDEKADIAQGEDSQDETSLTGDDKVAQPESSYSSLAESEKDISNAKPSPGEAEDDADSPEQETETGDGSSDAPAAMNVLDAIDEDKKSSEKKDKHKK